MPNDIITPATGAKMIADSIVLFGRKQATPEQLVETIGIALAGVYRAGFEDMRKQAIIEIIKEMRR